MKSFVFVIVILAFSFAAVSAFGQQTIFNIPSTDVLDRGQVYGELDVSFKTNCEAAVCRFSSFVPRLVAGAGHNIEIGLNVTGNIQPGADTTTLVPAFKWRPYHNSDKGWAIVAGDHVFIPVKNKSYNIGNYVYVEVSKSFKHRTRLTAGGHDFTKNVVAGANRAGGQFGFEQPVNKYLNINADWITGRHAAGYFTPGVAVKPHPKVTIYAGYSIGNADAARGNHFFLVEFGYNFK